MYETFSGLFVNVVVIVKSLVVWIGSAVPRLINFCVEPLLSFESFRKRTRMAGSSLKSTVSVESSAMYTKEKILMMLETQGAYLTGQL